MVVELRKLMGLMLMLSMFLIVTSGFLLADMWWEKEIIPQLRGQDAWSQLRFQMFTFVMMFLCSLMLVAVIMTFIFNFIGNPIMFGPTFTSLPLVVPITIVFTIMLTGLMYAFFSFIIYHIPMVFYLGVITFTIAAKARDILDDFLKG